MLKFDPVLLSRLMSDCLTDREVCPESVHHVVASLIQTSLRGVDSHGINLFPHYAKAVVAGRINPHPEFAYEQSAPSAGLLDADHGFGHHAGAVAMGKAVAMAQKTGVGTVSVRNSTHFGAAAYFGLQAPESGCLGFAFTNADALVKAPGARSAFWGTNPICFTAPLLEEDPFCLDMATSMVSWNKINNYRRENKPIPTGWAFDEEGLVVTDPDAARSLSPAGDYKGFGLGMMVDILCGLLAGGLVGKEIRPMYAPPLDDTKRTLSHFFMTVDISKFTDPEHFKKRLQEIVTQIRRLETLPQNDVMVAGDPEKNMFRSRTELGIPVDKAKLAEFVEVNPDFSKVLRR